MAGGNLESGEEGRWPAERSGGLIGCRGGFGGSRLSPTLPVRGVFGPVTTFSPLQQRLSAR